VRGKITGPNGGAPRIGIPRALLGIQYHALWTLFLRGLGCTVVASPATNKDLLFAGVKVSIDDICIPVKAYLGHVLHLKALGVDALMVPRMYAIENSPAPRFTCPKFMGLPDLVRAILKGPPLLLDADVNLRERPLVRSFVEIGGMLGFGRKASTKAFEAAAAAQALFEGLLAAGRGFGPSAAAALGGDTVEPSSTGPEPGDGLLIATVGHPYLIHDDFLSFSLKKRLERLGARVVENFSLPRAVLEEEAARYHELSWSYERELLGAVSHFVSRPDVDGIVFLTSFACGTFAVVSEIIDREVRPGKEKPILYLMVDELSGDAGVQTRLESFYDMLVARRER